MQSDAIRKLRNSWHFVKIRPILLNEPSFSWTCYARLLNIPLYQSCPHGKIAKLMTFRQNSTDFTKWTIIFFLLKSCITFIHLHMESDTLRAVSVPCTVFIKVLSRWRLRGRNMYVIIESRLKYLPCLVRVAKDEQGHSIIDDNTHFLYNYSSLHRSGAGLLWLYTKNAPLE